jgi:hypothetical protein
LVVVAGRGMDYSMTPLLKRCPRILFEILRIGKIVLSRTSASVRDWISPSMEKLKLKSWKQRTPILAAKKYSYY